MIRKMALACFIGTLQSAFIRSNLRIKVCIPSPDANAARPLASDLAFEMLVLLAPNKRSSVLRASFFDEVF